MLQAVAAPHQNQYVKIFRALQLHSTTQFFFFHLVCRRNEKRRDKKHKHPNRRQKYGSFTCSVLSDFITLANAPHTRNSSLVYSQKLYFTERTEWNPYIYIYICIRWLCKTSSTALRTQLIYIRKSMQHVGRAHTPNRKKERKVFFLLPLYAYAIG